MQLKCIIFLFRDIGEIKEPTPKSYINVIQQKVKTFR